MLRRSSALIMVFGVVACSTSGPAPVEVPVPLGEFEGWVTSDGVGRQARLSVRPSDDGLSAVLQVDDRAPAFGIGEWRAGRLFLGLDYGASQNTCSGRILLTARPSDDSLELSGQWIAKDCTGPAKGEFDFSLFSADPSAKAAR